MLAAPAPAALANDRIYWANATGNEISVANLDGSRSGTDLDTNGASPANRYRSASRTHCH